MCAAPARGLLHDREVPRQDHAFAPALDEGRAGRATERGAPSVVLLNAAQRRAQLLRRVEQHTRARRFDDLDEWTASPREHGYALAHRLEGDETKSLVADAGHEDGQRVRIIPPEIVRRNVAGESYARRARRNALERRAMFAVAEDEQISIGVIAQHGQDVVEPLETL